MAYNPFDDVILNDPAYMANGGQLPRPKIGIEFPQATQQEQPRAQLSVRPTDRIDYSQQKDQFRPVSTAIARFYKLLTPEQETLDQIEKDQQLRSLATQQAFQGTEFEEFAGDFDLPGYIVQNSKASELLKNVGYQPEGFVEGMSRVGKFFYGNQRKAFEKMRDGEQLTSEDRISIALAPLDSLDFLFPPLILKKLAGLGLKNVNAVLKSTADLPEVKQIQKFFGGEPLPAIGRADGPPGMDLSPRVNLVPDRNGVGGGSAISDEFSIVVPETNVKSKRVDEKVKKIIKENPDGPLPTSKLRKNYNIEAKTYDKSIDRLSEANPNLNINKYKRDPEGSRKKLAEEATERLNKEFRESIEGLETVDEIIANTKYTSKTSVYSRLQKLGDEALLRKYFYQQVSPDETANSINNFLKANPNTNYTLPEVAESLGINYQTAYDQVAKGKITQKNLFTHQDKMGYENDIIITEMNRLLDDIDNNIIEANKGPLFYQQRGYDIRMNSAEDTRIRPYLNFPTEGIETKLNILPESLANVIGTKRGTKETRFFDIKNFFSPSVDKGTASKLNAVKSKTANLFRTLKDENKKIFVENMIDGFGFTPIKKFNEQGKLVPNPDYYEGINKGPLDNFYNTIESISDPGDIEKIQELLRQRRSLNKFTDKEFYNALANNKNFRDHFISEVNRVKPDNKFNNDWESMYRAYKQMFNGQLSHVAAVRELSENLGKKKFSLGKGLEGKGGESGLIRLNFDNHNISLQPRMENATRDAIKGLSKAIKNNSADDMKATIERIMKNNDKLAKRGMLAYMRFTDKEMTDNAFKVLKQAFPNQVFKTTTKFGKTPAGIKTIVIGDPFDPSVNDLKKYFKQAMDGYIADPKKFKLSRANPKSKNQTDQMFVDGDADYIFEGKLLPTSFKQGGPVRMAIGGDPLENINQQQFAPDPAFEGKDFFQEAVDSGSLTAFNPLKLFKVFGKVDAVETPKKKIQTDTQEAPPGTTLPATQEMQPSDFALKSFTLETIMDPNAPKAARPQDWQNFFKGKAAPEAELRDSGILQYLGDFNKYFPNQKITQQQLVDFYETSPMGNISIKVKEAPTGKDAEFENFVGRPRHLGTGQQPLDQAGKDYREVVVQAGPLPGEGKPFVASGHFSDENVIGFTRVANYNNASGQQVAVIQELQTDMLTQVRKEQERLNALLKRIENVKAKAQERIGGTDEYYRAQGQRQLDAINQQFPPATLQKLQENLSTIKPFPNTAGAELIPDYAKQLSDLQKQINELAEIDITNPNPQTIFGIDAIETQQQKVLDNILDLTRDSELERDLKGIQVPSTTESDELVAFGQSADDMNLQYGGFKDLELFPPIPFNKQPDYVDLLIKATIKDAQTKGINKVAIMPAEKVNRRWGKDPDAPEGKKFKNLYDQVAVQQLKNIAKKYKGNVAIEQIIDTTKPKKALKFFNKDVDGNLSLQKEDVARPAGSTRNNAGLLTQEEIDEFYNEQIRRFVSGGGYREKDVVLTREIAPGQYQDFFVQADDDAVNFVPLGEGESIKDALIVIEEFNPQAVDMVTLTLDSPQSKEPFFMFKKKDGGTIAKDSLVSVTDIFGQYGR